MTATRNHSRALGQTKISISISKEIVRSLDVMAKQDRRSRSNLIEVLLAGDIEKKNRNAA